MTTNHHHAFNYHTGHPRFHFEEPPPAPPPSPPPAPPPPTAWHTGVEAETLGFWQNKGLPLDDPKAFASKLTELYRQAEKHFGVPADRLVKMPAADAKPEDLRAFYERLGAPKEAKDYDLSPIKDASIAESLRAAVHERGVPKDVASVIAATIAKALDSKATSESTVNQQKLADQKAALKVNWGDKYDFNHLTAMEGARRAGITPEAVKALEGEIGYDKVMEHFRRIGANTREDQFVERGAGATGEVTTREGALSRKGELMADKAWCDRWLAGGQPEKREMERLEQMISGVTL